MNASGSPKGGQTENNIPAPSPRLGLPFLRRGETWGPLKNFTFSSDLSFPQFHMPSHPQETFEMTVVVSSGLHQGLLLKRGHPGCKILGM